MRKNMGHHIGGVKYGFKVKNEQNIYKLKKNKYEQMLGYIKEFYYLVHFLIQNKIKKLVSLYIKL